MVMPPSGCARAEPVFIKKSNSNTEATTTARYDSHGDATQAMPAQADAALGNAASNGDAALGNAGAADAALGDAALGNAGAADAADGDADAADAADGDAALQVRVCARSRCL